MKVTQFIAAALLAAPSVAFFAPISPNSLMRGQRVAARSSSVTALRMGDETLEQKVIDVVGEQLGMKGSVMIDSNFIEDLAADSLDTIELIMSLEEEFGIEIAEKDAQKMLCVKDAVDYITANK